MYSMLSADMGFDQCFCMAFHQKMSTNAYIVQQYLLSWLLRSTANSRQQLQLFKQRSPNPKDHPKRRSKPISAPEPPLCATG